MSNIYFILYVCSFLRSNLQQSMFVLNTQLLHFTLMWDQLLMKDLTPWMCLRFRFITFITINSCFIPKYIGKEKSSNPYTEQRVFYLVWILNVTVQSYFYRMVWIQTCITSAMSGFNFLNTALVIHVGMVVPRLALFWRRFWRLGIISQVSTKAIESSEKDWDVLV